MPRGHSDRRLSASILQKQPAYQKKEFSPGFGLTAILSYQFHGDGHFGWNGLAANHGASVLHSNPSHLFRMLSNRTSHGAVGDGFASILRGIEPDHQDLTRLLRGRDCL